MDSARKSVLDKLYGNALPQHAVGLDRALSIVFAALKSTMLQRRGQQCMLLGARGTGKTLVVEKSLQKLEEVFPGRSIVLRINGMTHTEDRQALRELARQMDKALGVSKFERIHSGESHNDKKDLTDFLSDRDENELIEKPSLSQTLKNFNYIFDATAEMLESQPDREVVRVIIVVEELDRYLSNHQVLIYELLDLSLTSQIGVTIIGTSVRLNVLELFEKRNRSRSSAMIFTMSKPHSVENVKAIAEELLKPSILCATINETDTPSFLDEKSLNDVCETVFYTTNSVRHLQALLLPFVLNKSSEERRVMVPSTSASLLKPIESVPEIDWAMLICAARALVRYETLSVNLVLVMDEWRALSHSMHANRFADISAKNNAKHTTGNQNQSKLSTATSTRGQGSIVAARHAWERLRKMGLLETTATSNAQEDLRMYVPELDLDDLRSLLPKNYPLFSWTSLGS